MRYRRVLTLLTVPLLTAVLLPGVARAADEPLTVGAVQGPTTDTENPRTDRSPLAPASGTSGLVDIASGALR